MRSQADQDEQTLAIGNALALLVLVMALTIVGVMVGSVLRLSVGLVGVIAGTVALGAGAVGIVWLATPRHR